MAVTTRPIVAPNGVRHPQPRHKSIIGWLNLVRGASSYGDNSVDDSTRRYFCQKALEESYGSGRIITKGAGGWQPVTKAAMSETSGSTGGYLLPQDYSNALLESIAEHSFIFPRATVIPMFSGDLLAPRVDSETAQSAGVSPLLGGISFQWGMEKAAAETEPTFKLDMFHAWDLLGYAVVSNQWLMDAGSIQPTPDAERLKADPLLQAEHYLIKLFARAAAWHAEYAFLQGKGAGSQMPLGIVNSPATIQILRQTANQVQIKDIAGMTSSLLPYCWTNAIWAVSPSALSQVQQLAQYFINIELGGMHKIQPKPCGALSTMPLFITDKLPPLGNPGDLVLFDPSLYVIGQRQEVVVDVSPDDAFKNNQTTFRVWMRLDGKPQLSGQVTLQDGTTKASAYVSLK